MTKDVQRTARSQSRYLDDTNACASGVAHITANHTDATNAAQAVGAASTNAAWASQAAANTDAAQAAQAAAAGNTDAARAAQAAAAANSLTPSTVHAVQQSQLAATAEMMKQITSYQTFANSQASATASLLHFSPR